MTQRQLYALCLLQSFLSDYGYWEKDEYAIRQRVEACFRYADALIAYELPSTEASENDTPENKNKPL